MSASNDIRKEGEKSFEQLCASPEIATPMMCATLVACHDEAVRAMMAVMFRKRVSATFFKQLSPQSRDMVKTTVLTAVQQEPVQHVRHKLADTAGEIGAMILEDNEWPEIIEFLFQAGKAESPQLRESSMLMFSRLTFTVSEKLIPILPRVCDLFQGTLADPQKDVRVAALSAASCLVQVSFAVAPPVLISS